MGYIKLIPIEMKDITEYRELAKTGDPEFETAMNEMKNVSDNHYMSTLNEYGCSRLEKIMEITGTAGLSLEARRLLIISKANNSLPYTIYNLKTKIETLLGNDGFIIKMKYNTYHLSVVLFLSNYEKLNYVKENIENMMPANIDFVVELLYNEYGYFKKYKYGELRPMTHRYMREHLFEEASDGIHRESKP